jgi:hypothetical protein
MGGTLSGSLDVMAASSAALANPFSWTIAPPGSSGRFAGAFNGQVFGFSPFAVDYYIIDPSHGFFVKTDLANPNSSSGVVSFGYYAARTPVCATCFKQDQGTPELTSRTLQRKPNEVGTSARIASR